MTLYDLTLPQPGRRVIYAEGIITILRMPAIAAGMDHVVVYKLGQDHPLMNEQIPETTPDELIVVAMLRFWLNACVNSKQEAQP